MIDGRGTAAGRFGSASLARGKHGNRKAGDLLEDERIAQIANTDIRQDMVSDDTLIGFLAGLLTTASQIPQLLKSWRTCETRDLSLEMILALWTGLALWCLYGIRRGDKAIILANGSA
jgi:MtN3 and saliva related transmembrane protein